ncbi:hypothetical protein B0H19DRAFT_197978 [Mycena capillaripes]|nr:hypothetical protein B0H19DRAFT_197978 [Mycena capillaripes]
MRYRTLEIRWHGNKHFVLHSATSSRFPSKTPGRQAATGPRVTPRRLRAAGDDGGEDNHARCGWGTPYTAARAGWEETRTPTEASPASFCLRAAFAAADDNGMYGIAEYSHYVQGVAWNPLNEYIARQSSRSMHVYRNASKVHLPLPHSFPFRPSPSSPVLGCCARACAVLPSSAVGVSSPSSSWRPAWFSPSHDFAPLCLHAYLRDPPRPSACVSVLGPSSTFAHACFLLSIIFRLFSFPSPPFGSSLSVPLIGRWQSYWATSAVYLSLPH